MGYFYFLVNMYSHTLNQYLIQEEPHNDYMIQQHLYFQVGD